MIFDDGYQFGLGAFETIAVYKGKALFLKEHLERLNKALYFLDIKRLIREEDLKDYLKNKTTDYYALKIIVSEKNTIIKEREIPYNENHYKKGFEIDISKIRRNHTSPFVFHKTLNYGECIMEKRLAKELNVDEMLFLNMNDEICEGTTSNIFFIKEEKLYTPKLSCGLLKGILRDYILKTYDVNETIITPFDISYFDECFVTNSLMGIMPVHRLAEKTFGKRKETTKILNDYFRCVFRT